VVDILNYSLRGLVILIGLGFLFGVIDPRPGDDMLRYSMGSVITLFGVYRIIMYRNAKRKYDGLGDAGDEEDD
jgi:hypothetical protein